MNLIFDRHIEPIFILGMHLAFWVIIVWYLNAGGWSWAFYTNMDNSLLIPNLYGNIFNAIVFYGNFFWLLPMYFGRKNGKRYWLFSGLLFFCCTFLEIGLDVYYSNWLLPVSVPSFDLFLLWFWNNSIFHVLFWVLAFAFFAPGEWLKNRDQKFELQGEKLKAELSMLKAQVNPHFLFNGINSIYHLIGTDDEDAKKVLLKFSDLLRYQLYECNEDFISLKKEITYIENYISLEEVRKGEDAFIRKDLLSHQDLVNLKSGNGKELKIAPLLLTPFIENAFKYLSLYSEKEKNRLEVRLTIQNNNIHLFVENTIDPLASNQKNGKAGGIGLDNVKRRLELLYPARYQLFISENMDCFKVDLKIDLS